MGSGKHGDGVELHRTELAHHAVHRPLLPGRREPTCRSRREGGREKALTPQGYSACIIAR